MGAPVTLSGAESALPAGLTVSGMYLAASLEMVLTDENGTVGMVLRLHSYPKDSSREGYWAPPNLQYRVDTDFESPQTPRDLMQQFRRFQNEHEKTIRRDITRFAESFGLRGVKVDLNAAPLLEVKPSINQPSVTSAYYTLRFALRDVKEESEVNLLDREGRYGFVHFPLGANGTSDPIAPSEPERTEFGEVLYLGKPLLSSLQRILENASDVAQLRSTSILAPGFPTVRHEKGLVVVADIAGYGRVLTTNFVGILSGPEDEKRKYQAKVLSALEKALVDTGTTQVQTVGDGFVAAYPSANDPSMLSKKIFSTVANWTDAVRIIHHEVNRSLREAGNPQSLGSRLAINQGSYEWGRINGLGSFAPAFNGPAVVDAARLEQGLNGYMVGEVATGRLGLDSHLLAVAPSLSDAIRVVEPRLERLGWARLDSTELRAKERVFHSVDLFAWSEP